MNKNILKIYQEKENAIGKDIADNLLFENHTIRDITVLYPEYVLKSPFGLHRPGVNLGALLFLYKQVIAYVPPITREQFKDRFGIDYDSFIQLAYPSDNNLKFIFPVLNHPRRYRSPIIQKELSDILLRMPPTWERWHYALEVTGGKYWFEEANA